MAEFIKKNFSNKKFYKQITVFQFTYFQELDRFPRILGS